MEKDKEDWVMLPPPKEPAKKTQEDKDKEMLRLVTAVSEVMAVLGESSRVPLGDVSAAVRKFDCNSSLAIEYLLSQHEHAKPPALPQPTAPPMEQVVVVPPPSSSASQKIKCGFCEVLNPPTNVKCFVCDSALRPVDPQSNNSNSNNNSNNNAAAPFESFPIPEEMLQGDIDLTKSTELAIKKMLWEEHQEAERLRLEEEEATRRFLEAEQQRRQAELDKKTYECNICFDDCKIEEMYTMDECFHRFCRECITHHCTSQINDGNTRDISCPSMNCKHKISYQEVRQVVDKKTMQKFETFLLRATLADDNNVVWCPRPGCTMAMFVLGDGGLMLVCPSEKCQYSFCRNCRVEWHADSTCEQYQQWKKENADADNLFDNWRAKNTRPCPKCHANIEKNGGCNHMKCSQCRHEFCWLCMGAYARGHFSNKPGGCKQFT